jgi:hypothetical protein
LAENRVWLDTGPDMAGTSALLLQNALIAIRASGGLPRSRERADDIYRPLAIAKFRTI